MKRLTTWFSAFTLFAIFAVAGAPAGFAGAVQPTQVLDYETIFGRLDADGSPRSVRLVNQLRVFGEGDVVITDLAPTQDFRNLTGKGSPSVGDDTVEWTIRNLSGSEELVSSGTPDIDPPLGMLITYYRNGEQLPGPDAVGKSGTFDVTFDIANQTAEPTTTTITNAAGKAETVTQMVPLPMVAELTLILPMGRFTKVDAPGADVVTDPNGNLVVRWAIILVPPIGELNQSFNLRVDSGDFQIDAVRLEGVPVAPNDRAFLAFTQDDLSGNMERAASLYGGAGDLSSSMSDLHDGTLDLVDGTLQLAEGGEELADGLDEAADGSAQITSGGGQITSGLGQLGSGLRAILSGLNQLAGGLPAARTGAQDIRAGAQGIEAIANALSFGSPGLPDIKAGGEAIAAGATTAKGAVQGIKDISDGMGALAFGASALCGFDPDGFCDNVEHALLGDRTIQEALDTIENCLIGSGAACGSPAGISGIATGLLAPTGLDAIIAGGLAISAGVDGIVACLVGGGVDCGPGNPSIRHIARLIASGALQLAQGIAEALAGLGNANNQNTLIGGTTAAVAGVDQLTAGASRLTSGSGELTAGLNRARDGARQIADGQEQAHDGAGQIEQGVYLINELGLSEVAKSANEAVANLDRQLQLLEAQNERAENFTFYGPPSADQAESVAGGAGVVLTMDALSNRGADTTTRGIGILIVLVVLLALWLIARAMRGSPAEV